MKKKDPIPERLAVPLRKPIKLGEIEHREIRLREPTAGELLEIDGLTGWARRVKKIVLVSGIPEAMLAGVGMRDIGRADAYLARFAESAEASASEEIPDSLVIELRRPVSGVSEEGASEIFHRLSLREPNAGEMIKLDKVSGWKADVTAISLISGLPMEAVLQIGERDARRASEYLGRFLPEGPSTGASA